jgi:hypothetical protein
VTGKPLTFFYSARKVGGRRSCAEVRGRWDVARKEVGRRITLRKEG